MAELERMYTIPLRREWLKSPRYRRAKKAVSAVRKFLVRHMKSEDVLLGKYLNLEIWKHGMRNPPHKIRVNVKKDEKGVVRAELVGAPVEKSKEAKKAAKNVEQKEQKSEVKSIDKSKVVDAEIISKKPEVKKEEKSATKKVASEKKT